MLPRESPKSPIALPAAALAVIAVLGAALWVRADASPPFQGLDDAWLRLMGGPHEGVPWAAAEAFHHGGGYLAGVGLLALACVLTAMRRWRSALFAVVAFGATYTVTSAVKLLGDRPRPEDVMVAVSSPSFPSGHSSRMACVVVILAVVAIPVAARRWWWPVGALLVLGMMWARTWQHAHWLTDTVGGVALGFGVSVLCWRAFEPMLRREREEREEREAGPGLPARTGDARAGVEDLTSASPPSTRQRETPCRTSPSPSRSRTSRRLRRPRTRIRTRRRDTATRTRRPRSGPTTACRSPRWSSASSGPATRSASSR